MSTKHVCTIGDLVRFGCGLKIDCLACGGGRTFNTGIEAAKAGIKGEIGALSAKLVCSRCGAREARLTALPPVS